MQYEIEELDDIDIANRLSELELPNPTRPAWLPYNIGSAENVAELHHLESVPTLEKLIRDEGIEMDHLPSESREQPTIHLQSGDLLLAALYISNVAITLIPQIHAIIDVIANYAREAQPFSDHCQLDVVVEKDATRETKRLRYSGRVEGLTHLKDAISALAEDEQ